MLKKRLIFTLLYENGTYMLSRNFRLQAVGDLKWLKENYEFDAIAYSIDELVVLNVGRSSRDTTIFARDLLELSDSCFLPIAAGGGIRSLEDGFHLLNANADKLVVNTPIFENQDLIRNLARTFGNQCVVASIDSRKVDNEYFTFIENGTKNTGLRIEEAIKIAEGLGAGEIYLTSIDRDGTGFGYDLELIERVSKIVQLPFILSGGVGKNQHFCDGLAYGFVGAVSTANIYNFIVAGLTKARAYIEKQGFELAKWDYHLDSLRNSLQSIQPSVRVARTTKNE